MHLLIRNLHQTSMVSLEQFIRAVQQLPYQHFSDLKSALDKGDRRRPKSVWGNLSVILFGRNKDHKRASLSLKWHLNRGNFQDQVRDRFQPNSHESAREVDTYQLTTEHICSQLETATSYSLADDSLTSSLDITANSIECDVSDNKLLGLLASNCKEPELYHLRTTMASSPPSGRQI